MSMALLLSALTVPRSEERIEAAAIDVLWGISIFPMCDKTANEPISHSISRKRADIPPRFQSDAGLRLRSGDARDALGTDPPPRPSGPLVRFVGG